MKMMKKIKILVLLILLSTYGFSQVVTTTPENPSAVEPITIRVDVSSVAVLNGVSPLYLWAWVPGCCDSPTNGEWTNSNETNRMTEVEPNIWEISFSSLKDFYQQPAGAIGEEIGFLVKAKDGTGDIKTNDLFLPIEPPRFVETEFRTFPANFSQNDIATIIYNPSLDTESDLVNASDIYVYMAADLKDGSNVVVSDWVDVGSNDNLKLTQQSDGKFMLTMIPAKMFSLTDEQVIDKITFVLRNQDGSVQLSDRFSFPFVLKTSEKF